MPVHAGDGVVASGLAAAEAVAINSLPFLLSLLVRSSLARDGAQGTRLVGSRCETRFLRLRAARTALAKTLRAALLCSGVSCWTPMG